MFILKGIKNFLSDLYHNRIAILCIIIYMSVTQYLFHSVCPIAILFGFPCPACGLTRAGISFLTAHFSTAFQMNPCIFLLIPYFLYLWFYKYIFEKKPPYLTFITCLLGIIVFGIYILRLLTHTLPSNKRHNNKSLTIWRSARLSGIYYFSNPYARLFNSFCINASATIPNPTKHKIKYITPLLLDGMPLSVFALSIFSPCL